MRATATNWRVSKHESLADCHTSPRSARLRLRPCSGIGQRAVLFDPMLFSLRIGVRRLHPLDGPKIDRRLVDVDLPAITPFAYEGIERRVDAFQPPRPPLGSSCASNLINPNPDKIVRCVSADKELVVRHLVKGNACIKPGQTDVRV